MKKSSNTVQWNLPQERERIETGGITRVSILGERKSKDSPVP